jgi:hypothetical protein
VGIRALRAQQVLDGNHHPLEVRSIGHTFLHIAEAHIEIE